VGNPRYCNYFIAGPSLFFTEQVRVNGMVGREGQSKAEEPELTNIANSRDPGMRQVLFQILRKTGLTWARNQGPESTNDTSSFSSKTLPAYRTGVLPGINSFFFEFYRVKFLTRPTICSRTSIADFPILNLLLPYDQNLLPFVNFILLRAIPLPDNSFFKLCIMPGGPERKKQDY